MGASSLQQPPIRETALAIWDRLAARGFAGWDPYAALNAERLPAALKNARFFRRTLPHAVKRSPLPLQPLLGVTPQADAYTLGHALLTAARLGKADACGPIVTTLRAMAVGDGGQRAWGYHFPVHTRFFSYVPPTPNLIVTAFVAKGLAAATRAGFADCSADLRGAVAFVLNGLPRVADGTGQCVGYVPGESTVVHNANMLAAMVLCEATELLDAGGGAAWLSDALACARFTAARQAPDGSWPYSDEPYGRWVDGFHTGFVLEGLARVVRTTGDEALGAALERGVRFYVAQLFGAAGEPKYYPAHAYPYDALSAAQGVETLRVVLGGAAGLAVPDQLEWIRSHLLRPGGRVAYQVHPRWTDWREFPRWASAPLMSALAGAAATEAGVAAALAGAAATEATA